MMNVRRFVDPMMTLQQEQRPPAERPRAAPRERAWKNAAFGVISRRPRRFT
jgi:hypothetical protein